MRKLMMMFMAVLMLAGTVTAQSAPEVKYDKFKNETTAYVEAFGEEIWCSDDPKCVSGNMSIAPIIVYKGKTPPKTLGESKITLQVWVKLFNASAADYAIGDKLQTLRLIVDGVHLPPKQAKIADLEVNLQGRDHMWWMVPLTATELVKLSKASVIEGQIGKEEFVVKYAIRDIKRFVSECGVVITCATKASQ